MPDNDNTNPYDLMLAEIANLKKDVAELRKKNDDLAQFNKALFERQATTASKPAAGTPQTDTAALLKKFDAYIKGE